MTSYPIIMARNATMWSKKHLHLLDPNFEQTLAKLQVDFTSQEERAVYSSSFPCRYAEALFPELIPRSNPTIGIKKGSNKKGQAAPDFKLNSNGLEIAVECTTPLPYLLENGGGYQLPFHTQRKNEILPNSSTMGLNDQETAAIVAKNFQLKVAQAVKAKIADSNSQYVRSLVARTLDPQTPFLLFISLYGYCPMDMCDIMVAFGAQPVFFHLIGSVIPISSNLQINISYETREVVGDPYVVGKMDNQKANGARVNKNIFETHPELSGVIFSAYNFHDDTNQESLLNDMILLHNPYAINKIPRDTIKVYQEYDCSNEEIRLIPSNWRESPESI